MGDTLIYGENEGVQSRFIRAYIYERAARDFPRGTMRALESLLCITHIQPTYRLTRVYTYTYIGRELADSSRIEKRTDAPPRYISCEARDDPETKRKVIYTYIRVGARGGESMYRCIHIYIQLYTCTGTR